MKIALLSEKFPPDIGGLAVSAGRLSTLLSGAGHNVQVFSLSGELPPGQVSRSQLEGIAIERLGVHPRSDDTLADWFDLLVSRHSQQSYDLLQAYFITQAGFIAAYCGNFLGVPSVISARGNDLDKALFDSRKTAHILYALQNASAVTGNTHELTRKAQALAPGQRVFHIPNGVDGERFRPLVPADALRQRLDLPDGNCADALPLIAFVGEARAKKGLADLLLVYRHVGGRLPCALWLLGGARAGEDHDMITVFQKQNPQLPLIVTPYLPQAIMPDCYNLVDVLALPSRRDGLPNALLEGMACGCAIVASCSGGIPDAIQNGENGLLVPAGDVEALGEAMLRLLTEPDLRQRLGDSARRTALERFTLAQELEGNLRVYREVGVDEV